MKWIHRDKHTNSHSHSHNTNIKCYVDAVAANGAEFCTFFLAPAPFAPFLLMQSESGNDWQLTTHRKVNEWACVCVCVCALATRGLNSQKLIVSIQCVCVSACTHLAWFAAEKQQNTKWTNKIENLCEWKSVCVCEHCCLWQKTFLNFRWKAIFYIKWNSIIKFPPSIWSDRIRSDTHSVRKNYIIIVMLKYRSIRSKNVCVFSENRINTQIRNQLQMANLFMYSMCIISGGPSCVAPPICSSWKWPYQFWKVGLILANCYEFQWNWSAFEINCTLLGWAY